MSPSERLELLGRVEVALRELAEDLAPEHGHRAIMARAQIETAQDATGKARAFLLSASSSTYKIVR